jgi:acyl-CoA thioesterase
VDVNSDVSTDMSTDAVVARAAEAAARARPEFGAFFLARFLDLDISYDDEARTCTVVLPYAPHLCNPQGTVHGGVLATVMDVSMGHLCHHFLPTAVTIEMNLRFFRPLTGRGRCTAEVLNGGRRLVHMQSRLTDDEGRLVAFAAGSWHRLDAKDPKPSST